jgi:hypothetical protein
LLEISNCSAQTWDVYSAKLEDNFIKSGNIKKKHLLKNDTVVMFKKYFYGKGNLIISGVCVFFLLQILLDNLNVQSKIRPDIRYPPAPDIQYAAF